MKLIVLLHDHHHKKSMKTYVKYWLKFIHPYPQIKQVTTKATTPKEHNSGGFVRNEVQKQQKL